MSLPLPVTQKYLLSLDLGTTNSKALLVNLATGEVVAQGVHGVEISFPAPGHVEQDAEQIWSATLAAIQVCTSKIDNGNITGITISNQRESVVAWDATTGTVLGPVLGWQDARQSEYCATLAAHATVIQAKTGLTLDPMFSAPKMRWLLDTQPQTAVASGQVRVGTIETFIVERLTGQFVAEAGNASRTLLLSLAGQDWDPTLLSLFGIPRAALATVVSSNHEFGVTRQGLDLPAGIPVVAIMADSHAALYLHAGEQRGHGKATYGTGTSVMVPANTATGDMARTVAWRTDKPTLAREGNILASGAALSWMAQILTGGDVTALGELAQNHTYDPSSFVPALSGLGAPYYDRNAAGLISGISAGTSRADLAYAAFDAVAQQVADVIESIEADPQTQIEVLHADGGASVSAFLMQLQADLLGRPVHVAQTAESSALGVALLGAEALGHKDARTNWAPALGHAVVVLPTKSSSWRQRHRNRWAQAIARSRGISVGEFLENDSKES